MRELVLGILLVAACGSRQEASPPIVEPAAPDAAPVAASGCTADATHCCMPDGRVVAPGGCQPSYPDGVQPATERNADGTCRPIECHLKCLPAAARIATPGGDVRVDRLSVGDAVWTADAAGRRVAGRVLVVSSLPVTGRHRIVELTLADGRTVRASGGHPDARGTALSDLATGDLLDGVAIRAIRGVPYDGTHTWDLLPSGPTGTYWADGILLGSTLR
jgi:hypothetical protein